MEQPVLDTAYWNCSIKLIKKEYRLAAEEAFAYENNWFNAGKDNWPDFRVPRSKDIDPKLFSYAIAWCHGAPGIGLSRIRAYDILKGERYLTDSYAAIRNVIQFVEDKYTLSQQNYSLCHGLGGICELLIYGTSVLRNDMYLSLAMDIGMFGIDRYGNTGLSWPCGIFAGETPDLMVGLAGIGYFYLRLSDPKIIPSILIILPP